MYMPAMEARLLPSAPEGQLLGLMYTPQENAAVVMGERGSSLSLCGCHVLNPCIEATHASPTGKNADTGSRCF